MKYYSEATRTETIENEAQFVDMFTGQPVGEPTKWEQKFVAGNRFVYPTKKRMRENIDAINGKHPGLLREVQP